MQYIVTKERAEFIDDNFFEFSFDEREPDKELFETITNPGELHYLG